MSSRSVAQTERTRYLLGGAWNTFVGWTTFAAMYSLWADVVHYVLLFLIAQVAATANAFVTYRYFVFRVRGPVARDLARFSGVYLFFFVANLVALPLLVDVAGLPVLPAQATLLVATVLASYVAHKRVSFRRG